MNESARDDVVAELVSAVRLSTVERNLVQLVSCTDEDGLSERRLSEVYAERWGSAPQDVLVTAKQLVANGFLVDERTSAGTVFRVDLTLLSRAAEERLYSDLAGNLAIARRIRELPGAPEFENYIGKAEVIRGFSKCERPILEKGGTMYDMRDILPFVADTEDGLRRRHAGVVDDTSIERDCYRLRRRHELLMNGQLSMHLLLDRVQTEERLGSWLQRWDVSYTGARIAKFIELLGLESFAVVFSQERIDLKLEIIQGQCSALYWRSTKPGETDRLTVFWQPMMILGHMQYYWTAYYAALGRRDPLAAKAEVRAWAEAQLRAL